MQLRKLTASSEKQTTETGSVQRKQSKLDTLTTRQYLQLTKRMAVMAAVSFWRRHKIASRLAALFLLLVLLFSIFYQFYEPVNDRVDYDITGSPSLILSDPVPSNSERLLIDNESGKIEFNQNYSVGTEVAGNSSSPKIVASFGSHSAGSPVTISDPVNQVSVTFKPQFKLKEGRKNEDKVVYPIIGQDAVNVYTVKGSGVKEDIILRTMPSKDELSYSYDVELSDGLEMRLESDGSIGVYGVGSALLGNVSTSNEDDTALLKKARENGQKSQFLFEIPAPVVVGPFNKVSSATAAFSLKNNILTVSAKGLHSASYPLSIDPSVYVETAEKLMRGNNETNIDFDVDNELIQKSQTTGARIDAWQGNLDFSEGIWGHATATAGGYLYRSGGRTGATAKPRIVDQQKSFQDGNSTSFTMNMPATRPAGDLYVAVMCHDGTGSITPPAGGGWTEYADLGEHAAYYKVGTDAGGGNEASSYTWTGGNEEWAGVIVRVTGFNPASVVSGTPGTSTGSGVPVFPATTPTTASSLVIRAVGADNDNPSGTGWVPAAHTKIDSDESGSGANRCGFVTASMDNPPAASVSTGTVSLADSSINDTYGASSIAINPVVLPAPATKNTVEWAQFNSSTYAIQSPNPGTGACSGWCNQSVYNLPEERRNHSMIAYNGYLYVMGGQDGSDNRESTVLIAKLGANGEPSLWHPTDTNPNNWVYWYSDTGLSGGTAKNYMSAVAYNNRMYIIGGQTNASPNGVTTVERADILPNGVLGSWTTTGMQVLPSGAGNHMGSAQVYNDTLYVLGGFEGASTSTANLRSSVYYSKLNTDGTMNAWQATSSFATARANYGGTFSYIWGAYIYLGGGCTAVNGSGRCTAVAADTRVVSINADGSLDKWGDLGNLENARIGYSLIGWQGGLYRLGGCAAQNGTSGECEGAIADVDYGVINPAGEVSTVNISQASGSGNCTGGAPKDCDIPPTGDFAGEGGQMLNASTILNGYLYIIGGCTNFGCSGSSGNVSYASIGSDGSLQKPATCVGSFYGAWCVDSSNRVNGTSGISAAGVTTFNNRIYLVGGIDESATGTQRIYYNSTNTNGSLSGAWSSVTFAAAGMTTGGDETGEKAYTYAFTRANPSSAGSNPGNLYILGGCSAISASAGCSSSYNTSVYKCNITTSGSVSGCSTSGQLQLDTELASETNQGLGLHSGTVYAGYIYLIGGYSDNVGDRDTIFYAKIDNSNNIVDAESGTANPASDDDDWIESANPLNNGRRRGWAFGYNGHIYAVGGYDDDVDVGIIPFIEWSKLNVSDGSSEPFVTSSVTLNQRWGLSMTVSNSYAYVIGGCDVGASPGGCSSFEPSIQTFQLYNNDSGSVADFTAQSDQTFSTDTDRWGSSSVVKDGYLYVAGGCISATDCTSVTDSVQYAPIDSANGGIGTWAPLASLPSGRAWGFLGLAGNDLYYVGGEDATDEKSEVYYITPDPAAPLPGEIEHYSAKREAEIRPTTAGWQSIAGTADTDTTSGTNGWVDSTNLTPGERYLIMAWGGHTTDDSSSRSGLRVKHGSTSFAESEDIVESDRTGTNRKKTYQWFTVWTAVTGEDLEVESFFEANGATEAYVEDVTLIAINAEELIADGDLVYDIDTTGGSLSTTPTAAASLAWTPKNENDDWWIMSYAKGDTVDINSDKFQGQLDVNGTVRSNFSLEGEDVDDTPLLQLGWTEQFAGTPKTVDLELSESASDMEWDAAGVFALRLNKFETFDTYANSTTTTLTQSVYSEAAAIDPNVSTSGDFLATGGLTFNHAGAAASQLVMQLNGSDVTDLQAANEYDDSDDSPGSLAELMINTSTGVKDFDLDVVHTSAGPVDMDERWFVGFSMQEAPNTWHVSTNGLPNDRTRFGATVWNDRIYVVGGLDDSSASTNTVYVSPQLSNGGNITSAWTTSTAFNVARTGAAVTSYANNLYLFGGFDGSNYLSDVQFTQINSDGTVDPWSYTKSLPGPLRDSRAVSANGYIYLLGGRSAASTCNPKTIITPVSANTTIASGNNPTGIGEWYETNVVYSGDRYGAAVAYDKGKIYTMGGGCTAPLSTNRHYRSSVNSQPQVAQYSRLIDTDTDVFPNSWLLNGLDNSIGARWQVRYRTMNDIDGVATDCGTADMSTFGQETNFGSVTLGDVNTYVPLDGSGTNINCARYYYFFVSIDASKTFGYPEDVNRGPTIADLSLFFTSDPSKRLRHGKTFTGGEEQPLDTPCRQSVDADCPLP